MRRLTDVEVQKARLLKLARSNIRLKHALAADAEINEKLPQLEREIDSALASGSEFVLDLEGLLEGA